MDPAALERLYITGDYSSLLEKIEGLAYDQPSTELDDIEKAICVSYHSRALIRLGKVNEAEKLLNRLMKSDLNDTFSISSLLYHTSIINLQNTQGNSTEALKNGLRVETLLVQKEHELSEYSLVLSFWSAFLYFLIGVAYFYEFKNDLARKYFQKSLDANQTNLWVKAKCLYYMAFLEQEKGNISEFFAILEKSLVIFQSIDARQGTAWIMAWQGQFFLQKGDFNKAKRKFSEALELFGSISDSQGLNLVNSLIGLMFYQQGKLIKAEQILEEAFDSSIKIGNPMILSYCIIPLLLLYIESGNRSKAQKRIFESQKLTKNSNSNRVKTHALIAEAIFLKSSSRFSDKAQAQRILLELLNDKDGVHGLYVWLTSDKTFSFLVIFHLAELYLDEFRLSEDNMILTEVRQLIDNYIKSQTDQKFSHELVELSLLKAKLLIIEGKIEKALVILEETKQDANINNFHRLEEKVSFEIKQINKEFKKWDAALKNISVIDRIEKVHLEEYIKAAQKLVFEYNI